MHVPIGNDGWYRRGGHRARYGQQPLEAAAMVDAQLAAFEPPATPRHFALPPSWPWRGITAKIRAASSWRKNGGCYDGLEERTVNYNMGAESTLAIPCRGICDGARRMPQTYARRYANRRRRRFAANTTSNAPGNGNSQRRAIRRRSADRWPGFDLCGGRQRENARTDASHRLSVARKKRRARPYFGGNVHE